MKRKDLYKTEGKNGKVFISALIITGIPCGQADFSEKMLRKRLRKQDMKKQVLNGRKAMNQRRTINQKQAIKGKQRTLRKQKQL